MTIVLIGTGLLLKGSTPKTKDIHRFQVYIYTYGCFQKKGYLQIIHLLIGSSIIFTIHFGFFPIVRFSQDPFNFGNLFLVVTLGFPEVLFGCLWEQDLGNGAVSGSRC